MRPLKESGQITRKGNGKQLLVSIEPELDVYPLVPNGTYRAYSSSARVYFDKGYKRWTCLIRWDLLGDDGANIARVPCWLSLGNGPKPHAGRRGRYLVEWVRAHGGPPSRGDRLPPKVFVRRIATVEVGISDPTKSAVPYSVVRTIVRWETLALGSKSVIV